MIVPELDGALRRLDGALGRLERAVTERFSGEGRGDLETELQLMGDDRARLAAEQEGAATHLARLEAAAGHVEERVEAAIGLVEDVLAEAEGASPGREPGASPGREVDVSDPDGRDF